MSARVGRRCILIVLLAAMSVLSARAASGPKRLQLSRWRRHASAPRLPAAGGTAQPAKPATGDDKSEKTNKTDKDDTGVVYLTKEHDLWIDKKLRQVVLKGTVSVREGNLEMFACPRQSKEYESIIAVAPRDMSAVHAGLLLLGAKPGHPAKFDPAFTAASGTQIDVAVRWTDTEGKQHESRGQDWVRNAKTGKALEYPWVFAGSDFSVDPENGEKHYLANEGDFICVVNFSDAMLDLSIESPKAWSEHVFEPFTQRIPPKGTDVELVLTPKQEKN